MLVKAIPEPEFRALAFDHPGAQIKHDPADNSLHLTLDGVRYSAREAA